MPAISGRRSAYVLFEFGVKIIDVRIADLLGYLVHLITGLKIRFRLLDPNLVKIGIEVFPRLILEQLA